MNLDINSMNDTLMKEWLNRHCKLTTEQKNIIVELKRQVKNDLSIFYDMNKIIVQEKGDFYNELLNIKFAYFDNKIKLETNLGILEVNALEFREVLATIIDIYEELLPTGTVVDLKKDVYKNMFDINNMEHIRMVIAYRFIPYNDKYFITYAGAQYPYGPTGRGNDGLHFTPKTIENVVHRGYSDEQEIAYLFELKNKVIVEKNMHSLPFMPKDEYISIINNTKVTQS